MSTSATPALSLSPDLAQGAGSHGPDWTAPARVDTTAARLRRKRSFASAALTSRPSLLTLGRLVPSLETCVLIHTTSKLASSSTGAEPCGERQLVHALFEPNFYVDGVKRRVEKLDRAKWERIRASVEDLRIVGLASRDHRIQPSAPPLSRASSGGGSTAGSGGDSGTGEEGQIPPETSPRRFTAGADAGAGPDTRTPDCLFDLIAPDSGTGECEARSISTLLIQPRPYTATPASRADELLEFEIRGVGDGILAPHRWSILPDQVKRILEEADLLSQPSEDDLTRTLHDASLRDRSATYSHEECSLICTQILGLVAQRW